MKHGEEETLHVVTEQGMYGSLEMEDASKRKVQTKEEMDKEIEEAIARNRDTFLNK